MLAEKKFSQKEGSVLKQMINLSYYKQWYIEELEFRYNRCITKKVYAFKTIERQKY